MAKRCMVEKEKRRKVLSKHYEKKRSGLRDTMRDQNASIEEKLSAQRKMQKLPRDSNPCRRRNRCVMTGRSRGVYRKFGLTRHMLRELTLLGMVPGMRKASW